MSESKEFVYPDVQVGDTLRVSFDRAFSRPMLGFVNIAKNRSVAAIVFTERGPVVYPNCRFKDDPWLNDHTWVGEPGKAIFELTSMSELKGQVAQLKDLLAQQAQAIADLKARLADSPTPAKPGNRGRPRVRDTQDSELEPLSA